MPSTPRIDRPTLNGPITRIEPRPVIARLTWHARRVAEDARAWLVATSPGAGNIWWDSGHWAEPNLRFDWVFSWQIREPQDQPKPGPDWPWRPQLRVLDLEQSLRPAPPRPTAEDLARLR